MSRIYKYALRTPTGPLPMPVGAHIVSAGVDPADGRSLVVWAEVDPSETDKVSRRVIAVNTGDRAPEGRHIGTCIVGPIVWHVYDNGEPELAR